MRASSKEGRSTPYLTKREERRQKLRQKNRKQSLIYLWRAMVFSTVSVGLGYVLITNGWAQINLKRVQVKGVSKLIPISVINATGIILPQPLLSIDPQELENILLRELPIKSVSVRRRILPPILEVEVQEKKVIAYANRRGAELIEEGMIDKNANWIPLNIANKIEHQKINIYVEGWTEQERSRVSQILKQRHLLGSSLEKIILSPTGELNLKTKEFGMIYLGSNETSLEKQIKAIAHLSRSLPENIRNRADTSIDMRDPSKPELQFPINE